MATEGASGIVASYAAAWDAYDEGERPALERAWADEGVSCDPTGLVEGRLAGSFGPVAPG